MLKKLLDGLVFGTGFGIAFVAIWVIAFYFVVPNILGNQFGSGAIGSSEKEVNTVPEISVAGRYLGSHASYSRGFPREKNEVLTTGPGQIIGSALANGKPVKGLRLRLALNGSVMSQWAITNAIGKYQVNVPYGKYAVDGFELDHNTADRYLPNKIIHPQRAHTKNAFEVSDGNSGNGINFKFVDPISKKVMKNKYSVVDNVVLEWEPYPNATEYSVQLYEKTDSQTWKSTSLFDWNDRPTVTDTHINLKEFDVQLESGHFYVYEVSAVDKDRKMLSETHRKHTGYDFEIL